MIASPRFSTDWRRTPAGRRIISLALATAVHLLLLWLLLRLSPEPARRPPPGGPTTIYTVPTPSPEPQAVKRPSSARKQVPRQSFKAPRAAPVPPRSTTTTAQPWVINPDLAGFSLAPGTPHAQVAAADAPSTAEADAGGGQTGSGGRSAGKGPGGRTLYWAEWVREPTDAEMHPFLPRTYHGGGTADIACRTVERFRVEDCVELGQTPPGSGLSRTLREASFQFLIRPPRLNGKPMVGEWVRIHYVLTMNESK